MARVELRGVRQRPGLGLGADFDGANTVVSLVKGGAASQQGLLRLGDVVVSVNGVNVQGKKCLSAVPEEAAEAVGVTSSGSSSSSVDSAQMVCTKP